MVQSRTDAGLVGLGECCWGPGVETVVHHLQPLLEGEALHNVDWLYHKVIRPQRGACPPCAQWYNADCTVRVPVSRTAHPIRWVLAVPRTGMAVNGGVDYPWKNCWQRCQLI